MARLVKIVGQERADALMASHFSKPKRLATYGGMELVVIALDTVDDVPQIYGAEKNEDNMAAIKARQSLRKVLWKGTGAEFLQLLPTGKAVKKALKNAKTVKKVVKIPAKRPAIKKAAVKIVKRSKGPKSAK